MLGSQEVQPENQVYYELMIEELDRANDIISEFLGMAKNKESNLQLQPNGMQQYGPQKNRGLPDLIGERY